MLNKKASAILVLLSICFSFTATQAAYEEIECSSDISFTENSCSQCFEGGVKGEGDNIGFLTDDWINITDVKKIIFKEEQIMPYMVTLADGQASWSQTPSSEDFWEYTEEFDALYDVENEGNVLEPGQRVTWLQSKLSYAYRLDTNTAPEGENIGMLVYPLVTHEILSDGELTVDGDEHRECVLFKSGTPGEEVITPKDEPKRLPETGPAEYILLAILAMILGFGFLQLKNRA